MNWLYLLPLEYLKEFYDYREIGGRKFCDGGLLSNTPFRELLQAHQDYWLDVTENKGKGKGKTKIPDLEVYIVNVHPSKQDPIVGDDHDGVRDRINDITFFDRNSRYDENVIYLETDYTEIIDVLKDLATKYIGKNKTDEFKNDFENFLTKKAKSKSNGNKTRTYRTLLNSRFSLIKVARIENSGYKDSIYGKGADFTSKSIRNLIERGKKDAKKWLNGTRSDNKNYFYSNRVSKKMIE